MKYLDQSNVLVGALSFVLGCFVISLTVPIPKAKDSCETYTVSRKAVTSFVLKPPRVGPLVCPPVEACPSQVKETTENVSKEEISKENDTKPVHRYRRHRVRAYWKIRHEQ